MNPPNEPPKEFDVKRGQVGPPPTSRPIIVGHRPQVPDPMVHRISNQPPAAGSAIRIEVSDASGQPMAPTSPTLPQQPAAGTPIIHAMPQLPEQPLPATPQPLPSHQHVVEPLPQQMHQPQPPEASMAAQVQTSAPMPQPESVIAQPAQLPDNNGILAKAAVEPAQVQPGEDLKVHIPAGEAAKGRGITVYLVLLVVVAAVGFMVYYLFLKK